MIDDSDFEINHRIHNIWIISTRILISSCHSPTKAINSWKTLSGQKAGGKKGYNQHVDAFE